MAEARNFRPRPNAKNKQGRTALHMAAERGNVISIDMLLRYGWDLLAKDNNQQTALHLGVKNGQLRAVGALFRHLGLAALSESNQGRDQEELPERDFAARVREYYSQLSNSQDIQGQTALHLAAKNNQSAEMIATLLQARTNPRLQDGNGKTALALALDSGNSDAVTVLLSDEESFRYLDEQGINALLRWEIAYHHERSLVSLLNSGVGAETQYQGVLELLLTGDNTKVLLAFLKTVNTAWDGTRQDVQDALMFAVHHLCIESVEILTRVKFESDVFTEAFHRLIGDYDYLRSKAYGDFDDYDYLCFKAYGDFHFEGTDVFKSIYQQHNDLNIAQRLVDCGADVNSKRDGKTLLFKAVDEGFFHLHEMVQLLLDAGADVNLDWKGISPLHKVVQTRNYDLWLIKTLVQAGADVDGAQTPDGLTALGLAYQDYKADAFTAMLASRPENPSTHTLQTFREQDISILADKLGQGCLRELGILEVGESDS